MGKEDIKYNKFYSGGKMEIVDKVKKIIQELIIPELEIIKGENAEIKTILQLTNKRIDDINIHLVDQSRRIDDFRVELKDEIAKI